MTDKPKNTIFLKGDKNYSPYDSTYDIEVHKAKNYLVLDHKDEKILDYISSAYPKAILAYQHSKNRYYVDLNEYPTADFVNKKQKLQ
jgi:hypothetical protein